MNEPQKLSSKDIPFYRRPWFFFLSVLLFWPLSLVIMWTGKNYYLKRGGQIVPMGGWTKAFISVGILIMGLLYFAAIAQSPSRGSQTANAQAGVQSTLTAPSTGGSGDNSSSGQQSSDQIATAANAGTLPKCDSAGITDLIKERVADKGIEVLDIGKLREAASNGTMRYCIAAVSLSTGYDGDMSYSVLLGATGKTIIHVFPH